MPKRRLFRYSLSIDEEIKKLKVSNGSSSSNELSILKTKYNLGAEPEDSGNGDEVKILKKQLEEKNKEIKQLQTVIRNMNDLPLLHTLVKKMQAQVDCMESMQSTSLACRPMSSTSDSMRSTPSSSPSHRAASPSTLAEVTIAESDVELPVDEVIFCEHIVLTKGQCGVLKTKISAKEFVYCIMEMLWSREIISSHSVSGKTSNAFKERGAKPQLDQGKVSSICEYASKKFGCTQMDAKNIMRTKVNNVTKAERFKFIQIKK